MDSATPQPAKQLTLFVTFQVAPENIEKFKEAHRPVWKACSEEPECLLFDVFQDPEKPGRFRFIEVWSKSREWFEKVCLGFFRSIGSNTVIGANDKAILRGTLGEIKAFMDFGR
jgi:hypothetical protein